VQESTLVRSDGLTLRQALEESDESFTYDSALWKPEFGASRRSAV